ncbi:MAG: dienelactone hydrolase family protein, partial [Bacteroidota bacterium]
MKALIQLPTSIFLALILFPACAENQPKQSSLQAQPKYVGTQYFCWTDYNRADELYEAGAFREVMAQIWYPIADSIRGGFERAPYLPFLEKVRPLLSSWNEEDFDQLENIHTLGLIKAPILEKEEKYPLLIFCPSLGAHSSYYTSYAERFAQEGYVVLGINSKYESEYVLGESGKVTISNLAFHDSLKELSIPDQISVEDYRKAKAKRLGVIVGDVLFALHKLEDIPYFKKQIDFKNIGSMGHSIGGFAAVDAARRDARIKAVVNIDGTPSPEAFSNGIEQPFLFIEDLTDYIHHPGHQKVFKRREDFCKKGKSATYRVLIGETNHTRFYSSNLRFADKETDN